MKEIIFKKVVLINGVEHILSSSDYSECIKDYEENLEEPISDEEILDYIEEEV